MSDEVRRRRVVAPSPVKEVVEGKEEETEEDFVSWVQKQIQTMNRSLRLGADVEVSFVELQKALTGYAHVYNTLIAMYHEARINHQFLEESFKSWYGEKYIDIRSEVNSPDKPASKYLTSTEIEFRVMKDFRTEYDSKKSNLVEAERKVSFVRDLIEMWKAYQRNLSDISSNLRAEIAMTKMGSGL